MEQHVPVALQVALFSASIALIVLSSVFVWAILRFDKQCRRVVTAVERAEAAFAPLARDAEVTLGRLSELSGSAQRAADVAGELLLPPVLVLTQATQLIRAGISGFLQGLLTKSA